jgi:hypothetical protein
MAPMTRISPPHFVEVLWIESSSHRLSHNTNHWLEPKPDIQVYNHATMRQNLISTNQNLESPAGRISPSAQWKNPQTN